MHRKKLFVGILFGMLTTSFLLKADNGSYKETRSVIFTPEKESKIYLLQPSESISRQVTFIDSPYPTRKRLRVVGNVKMPVPFQGRGEEMFRRSEYYIDDCLDSVQVDQDHYSIYFGGEKDNFERHAYYRIPGKVFQAGKLTVELPIKRENLNVTPEKGDFGVEIELFYKKEGHHPDEIYDRPDSILYFSLPVGSGDFQKITHTFELPDNIACALLRIGGTYFSGSCWIEAPCLKQNGKQIWSEPFVPFAQRTDKYNYWVGVNLVSRSWPEWKVEFNDKTIFQGSVFDRASNVADFYITLPPDIHSTGELKLTLLKQKNRASYPYEIRSLEILEETARDFEVIAVPRYVTKGEDFGILIETNQPHVRLVVKASNNVSLAQGRLLLKEPGLHVIPCRAEKAGFPATFEIGSENRQETVVVSQIIEKEKDEVFLSSGDEIYIDKQYDPYNYFFKWYIRERIGNWYQFRPSYQWSGFRVADPEILGTYFTLLNQLNMPYAWQVEGRTLTAKRINPTMEVLSTPMFQGKQAHENDGGYYYWQHFQYQGVFSDMAARNRPYGGIFAKHPPIYTEHGVFIHYDPQGVKDMADGASKFVANLAYSRGESSRHTGPSTMFRYFYQAGYSWVGAEQMYGPEDLIMSSLRGASRAYGKTKYGSLHAMQWGSYPFTDPKHALRHYMSMAVAYMHGSSHINTEEALWTDEYANDRFSESGKAHLFSQHQILDFIQTHSRRGVLKSNIAVIQGRNDGWKSFGRGNIWSQEGEKWSFNKACESFDLLHVFYPQCIIDGCGPDGWFTSTPYGPVDLLPIEAPAEVMNQYKSLIFLGWNTYDVQDFSRIKHFVKEGGTLLLSAAHLNTELQPNKPSCMPRKDTLLEEMFGNNYGSLEAKTEISYGKGKIIYFPQNAYPSESSIRVAYEACMREIAEKVVASEIAQGWIKPGSFVDFTTWEDKRTDHRTIYLLNTDWQSNKEKQEATFCLGNKTFPIPVRRYHMETIHCFGKLGVQPLSNTTDILAARQINGEWEITVQCTDADKINIFNAETGTVKQIEVLITGIYTLKL